MKGREVGQEGAGGGLHGRAEERSLALHRVVARRLVEDPRIVERARERVRGWLAERTVGDGWARAWLGVLERPAPEIASLLCDPGLHACALRQSSPFAGVLDPRERWAVLRETRTAAGPAAGEEGR